MFRSFEPEPPAPEAGRVVTTIGWDSPPVRGEVARALRSRFGIDIVDIPDAAHYAAVDAPAQFAAAVRAIVDGPPA